MSSGPSSKLCAGEEEEEDTHVEWDTTNALS
jgi:hypothetical protein